MHEGGDSLEVIMYYLRKQEVSLISTMLVVKGLLPELSVANARDLVLNSAAWSDHKEAFWEFQEIVWTAVDIADEESEEPAPSA